MDGSDIIYFFLLGEGGRGSLRRGEWGGGRFLLKIPGGGGVSRRRGAEGAGRVSAANWGFGGGGS